MFSTTIPTGWNCSVCGAWVPNGVTHSCVLPAYNAPVLAPLTKVELVYFTQEDRDRMIRIETMLAQLLEHDEE